MAHIVWLYSLSTPVLVRTYTWMSSGETELNVVFTGVGKMGSSKKKFRKKFTSFYFFLLSLNVSNLVSPKLSTENSAM